MALSLSLCAELMAPKTIRSQGPCARCFAACLAGACRPWPACACALPHGPLLTRPSSARVPIVSQARLGFPYKTRYFPQSAKFNCDPLSRILFTRNLLCGICGQLTSAVTASSNPSATLTLAAFASLTTSFGTCSILDNLRHSTLETFCGAAWPTTSCDMTVVLGNHQEQANSKMSGPKRQHSKLDNHIMQTNYMPEST